MKNRFPSIWVPKRTLVRARTTDHAMTFDAARAPQGPLDLRGNQRGITFDHAYKTHDGRTVDSTGAFLVGELERLDQTLHMPLVAVTWSRDINLREDVSVADEVSSFTLSTFASQGNLGAGNGIRNGKAWIGKATDQIGGVSVDIGKYPQPLTPWGLEVKFSILELESAAKAGPDEGHEGAAQRRGGEQWRLYRPHERRQSRERRHVLINGLCQAYLMLTRLTGYITLAA